MLGSIEGGFISAPNMFKQTLGLFCRNYRFVNPSSDSDCSRVTQCALVLGSCNHVHPDPSVPAQSTDSAIQSDSIQESFKPKFRSPAPRATAIKELGLSEAVVAQIEAALRSSTRSVYEAKWSIFTKWCHRNQVGFRSPPIQSIADFLLYLF